MKDPEVKRARARARRRRKATMSPGRKALKRGVAKAERTAKKYPTLEEGNTSVRTVSGGGFEQNRRRH